MGRFDIATGKEQLKKIYLDTLQRS
jgi:hypothetical protein